MPSGTAVAKVVLIVRGGAFGARSPRALAHSSLSVGGDPRCGRGSSSSAMVDADSCTARRIPLVGRPLIP
jgi:hypothetical protein